MIHSRPCFLVAAAAAVLAGSQAFAATYNVINVRSQIADKAGVTVTSSSVADINNNGVVVGKYNGSPAKAFSYNLYTGEFIDLNSAMNLSATDTNGYYAYVNNDNNEIAGTYKSALSATSGYVYSGGTQYTFGSMVDDKKLYTISGMNNSGTVVGGAYTSSGAYRAGVLTKSSSTTYAWTQLSMLSGASATNTSSARSINEAGVVVGSSSNGTYTRAAKWTQNADLTWSVADLGVPSTGSGTSNAYSINNSGDILGSFGLLVNSVATTHMAIWKSNGDVVDIGTPTGVYAPLGTMFINDSGVIACYSQVNSSGTLNAFVGTVGSDGNYVFTNLNTLIDPNSGWVLNTVSGLNNDGVIIGTGTYNGTSSQAFALTLVPEPASLGMLALAASGLILRRRK